MVLSQFVQVAAALIVRDSKILVARRKSGAHQGLWEFPGGKREEQESLEQTLIREIKEELGLSIQVSRPLVMVTEESIILTAFICRALSQELHLIEHDQVAWLSVNEIVALDMPALDQRVRHYL